VIFQITDAVLSQNEVDTDPAANPQAPVAAPAPAVNP